MRYFMLLFGLVTVCFGSDSAGFSSIGKHRNHRAVRKVRSYGEDGKCHYINPFNPEEVDLRRCFTAPSGKVWEIFGFYDNFNAVNQWKVRFGAQ